MKSIVLVENLKGAELVSINQVAVQRDNLSGDTETVYLTREELVKLINFIDENGSN